MTKETKIIAFFGVAVLALVIFLIARNPSSSQNYDAVLLVKDNSHMTGPKGAKAVVVEFGDYQCPACAHANSIIQQVREAYKDNQNVSFVFRNFPLSIHSNAIIAAEAAEAAGAQGKFWEMHDMIYEGQDAWAENVAPMNVFTEYAKTLGLNIRTFSDDVGQEKFADSIKNDRADGFALNINATPTFFVVGQKVVGSLSLDEFRSRIDAKLQEP